MMYNTSFGKLNCPPPNASAAVPTQRRKQEMLERAEIRHGDKIIKRARPPLENPKEAVKLRLDHDVLAAYRKTGSGWQTRINADLRKAARKLAG